MVVLPSPTNVDQEPATNLQPDMSVAKLPIPHDVRGVDYRPLLVVEIMSPTSGRIDLLLKRDAYQRIGIPSYWIVDPQPPALTVLELLDGE